MRVFVAGASGVIGRRLVAQLLTAGHRVTGMTSSPAGAEAIESAGASAAVCDALDAETVLEAVEGARPEAVVNELTRLPRDYNPRAKDLYEATNRVRSEGGRNLLEAALAAGARRFVTQSIAFLYAPEGGWVKDEKSRAATDAPEPFGSGVRALLEHERAVAGREGLEGLVLRYGQFYGPGTYFAPGGSIAERVRKRRFPVIGRGDGVSSFVHVDDAAGATVVAIERGAPGIYNVVDDEPAPLREWLPLYAEALGAKPPRRVPVWLARIVAGPLASMAAEMRGASNARAKRELGWSPRHPSWRQGFRDALA